MNGLSLASVLPYVLSGALLALLAGSLYASSAVWMLWKRERTGIREDLSRLARNFHFRTYISKTKGVAIFAMGIIVGWGGKEIQQLTKGNQPDKAPVVVTDHHVRSPVAEVKWVKNE